jgi:ABC-type microcin C transport system permease subunit YejE
MTMNKNEVLKLALKALEPLEFVGKRMDGGNPQIDEAIAAIKKALKQPSWIGLDEDEFVYFCAYVNHEKLSEIENVLRDKNEQQTQ